MSNELLTIDIAKRLKDARKMRHLTIKQVVADTKISKPTLIKIECGRCSPSFMKIKKLMDYYKISPNYLVMGYDNDPAFINNIEKRKLYNLVELLFEGDIEYKQYEERFIFHNKKLKRDVVYCQSILKGSDLSRFEAIDKALQYIRKDHN